MASQNENENRIFHLESILRERDRVEAETKSKALEAERNTQDAKTLEARSQAALAEIEQVRRGSWFSHLIAAGDQAAAVDFSALVIPKEGWPPGTSPADYSFTGGTLKAADTIDVASTYLGKAFAALAPIKP